MPGRHRQAGSAITNDQSSASVVFIAESWPALNPRTRCSALAAAAGRVSTPSFRTRVPGAFLSVAGLVPRMSPMSRLLLPLPTQQSTSLSRGVRRRARIVASTVAASLAWRSTTSQSSSLVRPCRVHTSCCGPQASVSGFCSGLLVAACSQASSCAGTRPAAASGGAMSK